MEIDLYWFRHRHGHGNFGDELSPWLVKALEPEAVIRWVDPTVGDLPLSSRIGKLIKAYHRPWPHGHDLRYSRWHALLRRPCLLAVGSVIWRAGRSNVTVWGSGLISSTDEIGGGRFLAVRGPYTRDRLAQLGFEAPEAMGDPALLLPLLHRTNGVTETDVALIPHFSQFPLLGRAAPTGIPVVDLTGPIEQVTDAIASSRVTLSTSLHGIIVSHAFGIPSLWVSLDEVSGSPLEGDDVKFGDYLSSVGIEQSAPVEIGSLGDFDATRLRKLVDSHFGATLPARSVVAQRQRDLLLTAPFPGARAHLDR